MNNLFKIFNPTESELNEIKELLNKQNYSLTNDYFDYKLTINSSKNYSKEIKDIFKEKFYTDKDIPFVQFFHKKVSSTDFTLSGAESCTGGLVSKLLTDQPGSSKYFKHSLVTYANDSKEEILNVKKETLDEKGAVSKGTVIEMLDGLLYIKMTNLVYAISGIAGPAGGTDLTPVGTVFIGVMRNGIREVKRYYFSGNRKDIRNKATQQTLWDLYLSL